MNDPLQDIAAPTAIAVIGAGPAGLFAAERLAAAGLSVAVYERMPSVGRKLLMAGRGGLNLTHSEPLEVFLSRYDDPSGRIREAVRRFPPDALRAWAEALGQETFVGSSGRIFPRAMKASPLLRRWLSRLSELGVRIHTRHRWLGWSRDGALRFRTDEGAELAVAAEATLLAVGGASWPRLGSDGGWLPVLSERGVSARPLVASNVGFNVAWSEPFRQRHAGAPLKSALFRLGDAAIRSEAVITAYGIEGSAIYALSSRLRQALEKASSATLEIDLRPGLAPEQITERLARIRRGESRSNALRKALHLSPVAIGLLREAGENGALPDHPAALARLIKAVPVRLTGIQPIDRAISSAGGLTLGELDEHFMLKALPGTFAAGEMLDWDAPTGGYLLQATFATATAASDGIIAWLKPRRHA